VRRTATLESDVGSSSLVLPCAGIAPPVGARMGRTKWPNLRPDRPGRRPPSGRRTGCASAVHVVASAKGRRRATPRSGGRHQRHEVPRPSRNRWPDSRTLRRFAPIAPSSRRPRDRHQPRLPSLGRRLFAGRRRALPASAHSAPALGPGVFSGHAVEVALGRRPGVEAEARASPCHLGRRRCAA
jgi:hypothetical protein